MKPKCVLWMALRTISSEILMRKKKSTCKAQIHMTSLPTTKMSIYLMTYFPLMMRVRVINIGEWFDRLKFMQIKTNCFYCCSTRWSQIGGPFFMFQPPSYLEKYMGSLMKVYIFLCCYSSQRTNFLNPLFKTLTHGIFDITVPIDNNT